MRAKLSAGRRFAVAIEVRASRFWMGCHIGGGVEKATVIFPDRTVRIVIATEPEDFRMGHDGPVSMAQAELGFVTKAGARVVFRSIPGDRVRFLVGSGIVMMYVAPNPSGCTR